MRYSGLRLGMVMAAAVLLSSAAEAVVPRFKVEIVGDSSKFGSSFATDMNNLGQVVGVSTFGEDGTFPFLYQSGRMTKLHFGSEFDIRAINDHGDFGGILHRNGEVLPALYRNGHFTNVAASLGPGVGSVEAINELGHAGGDYVVNLPNGRAQPLYYDGTSATLLPFRGGFVDINEHDVLVTADGKIYDHGKLRGIPRLDAGHGGNQAAAINDLGQVVGTSSVRGANFIKASPFMYFNGVMTDLGSLGGDYADARDINNQGWVIGTSATADNRIYSFLYLDGTMFNLEKLLNPDAREHWSALSAWDINDRGQILVSGAFNPRGTLELALLTPVPELPVWALVLMGLGAVGTTVWRRRAAAA